MDVALRPIDLLAVAGHAEVRRIDDFVRSWIGENRFGMNSRFVGKGAEA